MRYRCWSPISISYILKEKHCNKYIHNIIDTWQLHNDLIINMLTRSHYIHKCVHTIYFVFFNIKLSRIVPIKLWIFRLESKQITNQKLNYIYIYIYIYYFYCLRIKLGKILINFDLIRFPF